MGTVPMGTALLRMIHSRVVWMSRPVDRSITVSAPQRVAQVSLSTSSAAEDVTADVPMLAFTLARNRLPIAMGSDSGWFTLAGMIARRRPQARGVRRRTRERLGAGPPGPDRGPAVVAQGGGPPHVVLDVAPFVGPRPPQRRQAQLGVAARPAGVVEPDRLVRRRQRHLGVRDPQVGTAPGDVRLAAVPHALLPSPA